MIMTWKALQLASSRWTLTNHESAPFIPLMDNHLFTHCIYTSYYRSYSYTHTHTIICISLQSNNRYIINHTRNHSSSSFRVHLNRHCFHHHKANDINMASFPVIYRLLYPYDHFHHKRRVLFHPIA